jgi:hypothetical protein
LIAGAFDLGHDDEARVRRTGGPIGLHPEHSWCNRRAAADATNGRAASRRDIVRQDVEGRYSRAGLDSEQVRFDSNGYPEDDLENGIFWGPPDHRTGIHFRWSQAWFDWRSDPDYRREA